MSQPSNVGHSTREPVAAREDSKWVLEQYDEAKDLLAEVRMAVQYREATLDADLVQRVEDFHNVTFMDGCTTLGADCACNTALAPGQEHPSHNPPEEGRQMPTITVPGCNCQGVAVATSEPRPFGHRPSCQFGMWLAEQTEAKAETARLRAALERIADDDPRHAYQTLEGVRRLARQALGSDA